jgi:hypothetical protein
MDEKQIIRHGLGAALIVAICLAGLAATASAQEQSAVAKPAAAEKATGRDPFKRYEAARKTTKATARLEPPSIQVRIERYRAQKLAAASAHVPPPKPTTALLLNEMQVIGVFRTPRGWAAMVEATPIKLSYVIYPGETFFDGQLVAIEEGRLVFRREIVWADGRREKSVEVKLLRQPSPVEAMTAAKAAPVSAPPPEAQKPAAPEKQ